MLRDYISHEWARKQQEATGQQVDPPDLKVVRGGVGGGKSL
jgi:hypothetical protein